MVNYLSVLLYGGFAVYRSTRPVGVIEVGGRGGRSVGVLSVWTEMTFGGAGVIMAIILSTKVKPPEKW